MHTVPQTRAANDNNHFIYWHYNVLINKQYCLRKGTFRPRQELLLNAFHLADAFLSTLIYNSQQAKPINQLSYNY